MAVGIYSEAPWSGAFDPPTMSRIRSMTILLEKNMLGSLFLNSVFLCRKKFIFDSVMVCVNS